MSAQNATGKPKPLTKILPSNHYGRDLMLVMIDKEIAAGRRKKLSITQANRDDERAVSTAVTACELFGKLGR